ncbi:MAG: hypothetical protein JW881_07485 [Spirochaetales bacterium]|nr:hypothetical protein [Spirochaetales bacterium]
MKKNILISIGKYLFLLSFISSVLLLLCSKCDGDEDNHSDSVGISITPAGGTYDLLNGYRLIVPEGAVHRDTVIRIKEADKNLTESIYERYGISASKMICSFEAEPDGLSFDLPLRLIVPVDIGQGDIPFMHELDPENNTLAPRKSKMVFDPEQKTLEIYVNHFSASTVSKIEDLLKKGEEYCRQFPCKCGELVIEQWEPDYICDSGNCKISESTISVTFSDCTDAPEEFSRVMEMTPGCEPEMEFTAGRTVLQKGEQTDVTAHVKMGCKDHDGQSVNFSHTGVGSIDSSLERTDVSGNAVITFTAEDEGGTATIHADADVVYSLITIVAMGEGIIERSYDTPKHKVFDNEVTIDVIDCKKWKGTMDVLFSFSAPSHVPCLPITADYAVDFSFTVNDGKVIEDELDELLERESGIDYTYIYGEATAAQSVMIGSCAPGWRQNEVIPLELSLLITGRAGDYLHIMMLRDFEVTGFFNFDFCLEGDCVNVDYLVPGILVGMYGTSITNVVPLKEGTYTVSHTMFDDPNSTCSYTINLECDR